jgi:hypothetical protein
MKRALACLATLLIVTLALAVPATEGLQQQLKVDREDTNPWTSLDLKNRPENFQFAIVTDRTGGHRPGVFPSACRKLNLLQPEFVMSVGDLIEGYTEDRDQLDKEWAEFNGFVDGLEMPFFYTAGNHDISNMAMLPIWQNQFGRTYYHFVYHDVLFMVLNSEDPPGSKPANIGEEQLAWAAQVLAENTEVRWTVVFLHKPMWQYGDGANWSKVEAMLGERPRTIFAGHHHRYAVHRQGKWSYYALATTGGGSKLEGPAQGRFDHVVWVTMTPDGPRLANLLLDGILSEDPVAEASLLGDRESSAEK